MNTSDPTALPVADPQPHDALSAEIDHQPVNSFLLVVYQVVIRTGWIFKTESIIMPAVLDVISGQGWVRGCLPMLNRFGQSIPPVLASRSVRAARYKKFSLALTTSLMGISFWALACFWLVSGNETAWWMPMAFLLMYGFFFVCTGVNHLIVGTVTGKFIIPNRRGRLMLFYNTIGVVSAVGCAWLLLGNWLSEDPANIFAIFAFAGTSFLLAAVVCFFFAEQPDNHAVPSNEIRGLFHHAAEALAHDREFRRLAIVASLFGMSTTLFPHYQALGRERLDLGLENLLPWVIAQNIGMFLFSLPAGWFADRYGNRIVLRVLLIVLCAAPIMALVLTRLGTLGGSSYFIVFGCVGATPVTIRIFQHYCLELGSRHDHPRYLSTMSLTMAVPAILSSALLGVLVDVAGFESVFLLIIACLAFGWFLSGRLVDPRSKH